MLNKVENWHALLKECSKHRFLDICRCGVCSELTIKTPERR